MISISKAEPPEMPKVIDFCNMVFSVAHGKIEFKTLQPKMYSDHLLNQTAKYHYLLKENDEIKANVAYCPIKFDVMGEDVNLGLIGQVSCHPYSQGKGYMKMLMDYVMKDIKDDGLDGAMLSGMRNRYQYWGFENADTFVKYSFDPENLKHSMKDYKTDGYKLIEITNDSNSSFLSCIKSLYDKLPVKGARNSELLNILKNWRSRVFIVTYNDDFVGYISFKEGRINEMEFTGDTHISPAVKLFYKEISPNSFEIISEPWSPNKNNVLNIISESVSISSKHKMSVYNFEPLIRGFLKLKSSLNRLADGKVVIKIEDKSYSISVKNNEVDVSPTTERENLSLSKFDACTLLFTPQSRIMKFGYTELDSLNWFPLPIYFSVLDLI